MREPSKATPLTVTVPLELRERLDREAVRVAVERGRPVSRSSVAAELLAAALEQRQAAAA